MTAAEPKPLAYHVPTILECKGVLTGIYWAFLFMTNLPC